MSRTLVPRFSSMDADNDLAHMTSKPRKISVACSACKQRKTKCSGSTPCDACSSRGTKCEFDVTLDQRRKIANQRNIQDLSDAQNNLERHRQLLGGIIAIIRTGTAETNSDLLDIIRSGVDLSQLAAHIRNARRSNPAIEQSFANIEFVIDGPEDLPSPTSLLTHIPSPPPSKDSFSPIPMVGEDFMPANGVDGFNSISGFNDFNKFHDFNGIDG